MPSIKVSVAPPQSEILEKTVQLNSKIVFFCLMPISAIQPYRILPLQKNRQAENLLFSKAVSDFLHENTAKFLVQSAKDDSHLGVTQDDGF